MAPSRSPKTMKPERNEKLNPKIQSLKRNMANIGLDEQRIREAQRNVRQRFASIKQECDQLRDETYVIIKKATITKIQLTFKFQILRSREVRDFSKAASLNHFLRFVIQKY